jgi:hypothetical protein
MDLSPPGGCRYNRGMSEQPERLVGALNDSLRGSFSNFPLSGVDFKQIVEKVALEAVGASRVAPEGHRFAPDQFTLSVHPSNVTDLNQWTKAFQREVSGKLQEALVTGGLKLARELHLTLATDPTLTAGSTRVIAWHSSDPLHLSNALDKTYEELDTGKPPEGAFLILDGKRHFRLKLPVIRIGRRLDNDLVLDDPHVSREHMLLKADRGRYQLVDLDSISGTRVNGRNVTEHWLKPGDVINVAAVELIYGEDRAGPPDETKPYSPLSEADRDHVTPLDLKALKDLEAGNTASLK